MPMCVWGCLSVYTYVWMNVQVCVFDVNSNVYLCVDV